MDQELGYSIRNIRQRVSDVVPKLLLGHQLRPSPRAVFQRQLHAGPATGSCALWLRVKRDSFELLCEMLPFICASLCLWPQLVRSNLATISYAPLSI